MRKQLFDQKNFYFKKLNGEDFMIHCKAFLCSNNVYEYHAAIVYDGDEYPDFTKCITCYNRTGEAFRFELVINKVLSEYLSGKNNAVELTFIKKQVQAVADYKRINA